LSGPKSSVVVTRGVVTIVFVEVVIVTIVAVGQTTITSDWGVGVVVGKDVL
jgi:hypothetical protein